MDIFNNIIELLVILVPSAGPVWLVLRRWVNNRIAEARSEYQLEADANKTRLEKMQGIVDILQEKIEEKENLLDFFKEENTKLIEQRAALDAEHGKRVTRLIEVETRLAEINQKHERLSSEHRHAQASLEKSNGDNEELRILLNEAERENCRYEGHRRAVNETFEKIGDLLERLLGEKLDMVQSSLNNVQEEAKVVTNEK